MLWQERCADQLEQQAPALDAHEPEGTQASSMHHDASMSQYARLLHS
jgi:hypothetical protein